MVTNSERRMSRQRAFLPLPGDARPDWRIVCDVARRMGYADAFAYDGPAAILREHAALSTFENDGGRKFDIGDLANISEVTYGSFEPRLWPAVRGGGDPERLFADGGFATPDGRARFVPIRQEGPALPVTADYPLVLNSGRIRDQWHTMTRTGRVPRLAANAPEPVVDLHPRDAALSGLRENDLARIETRFGFARARVRICDAQRPGHAFLPMHWSGQFAAMSGAGALSSPVTDAYSGQPELKHVPARIWLEPVAWQAALLTRRDLRPTGFVHWSRQAVAGGWSYALTGTETPDQGILLARALLPATVSESLVEYRDRHGLNYRAAMLDAAGSLVEALLVAPAGHLPDVAWLTSLLASPDPLSAAERRALLSGRAPEAGPSIGRVVCACFNVGVNQLAAAAQSGCRSLDAIGRKLGAGTNCGSCRSEIRRIVDAYPAQAAE